MAGNVVEWALRIKQTGAASAAKNITKIGDAADESASSVAKLGREMSSAAKSAKTLTGSLSQQFDAIQKTLPTSQNANAILFGQSVARGLANLKALRAAAKASAAPTDAEKMLGGALTDQLRPAQDLNVIQRGVRRFLQSVASAGGGRAIRALGAIYDGFEKAQPAIDAARSAAARAAPVMSALGTATLAAGAATVTLAGGAALLATKFAVSVVQAQAYRENIEGALNTLLRSQQAGKDALAVAVQTADMIGKSRSAVAGQFVDLLAKGFDVKKVDTIVRSLADLSTVDPRADLDRLTLAIGQIAATGRLQGDELNQLANSGLEASSVYDALAKRLGKTRAEVIKLKEAGKISSDLAIDAIIDAINMQSGGRAAGAAAAEKARKNLSGILQRFSNLPENLLFSIGVKPELATVKDSLNQILDYFEGPGFAKAATAIEGTFGALVKGFFGVDVGAEGGPAKAIDRLLDAVIEAKPTIESFAQNMRKVFDFGLDVITLVGNFSAFKNEVKSTIDSLGPLRTIIDLMFKPITGGPELLFDTIGGIVEAIEGIQELGFGEWFRREAAGAVESLAPILLWFDQLPGRIGEFVSSVWASALDLGTQIVAGIESGIMSAYGRAIDAISNVATGAIAAAKAILGIKSPSKVFEEIGMYTAMGFERGIVMNDNGAAADLVAPPDVSGVFAGGAAVGAGIAAGGAPVSVTINVDARGATAADAQRIADAIDERLVRTIENIAFGVGAAA